MTNTNPVRMAVGYEPNFDIDLTAGKRGEELVGGFLGQLRSGSALVEVKTDDRAVNTGNVYIETSCCYQGQWKPSGIYQEPGSDVWAVVVGNMIVAAPTVLVRRIVATGAGRLSECQRGDHPTSGVLFELGKFTRMLRDLQQ